MKVNLADHMTWPQIGSVWTHRNGNSYCVVDFTNVENERQDEYPTTIIYRNIGNGNKYSRRLDDWDRSMTFVRSSPV